MSTLQYPQSTELDEAAVKAPPSTRVAAARVLEESDTDLRTAVVTRLLNAIADLMPTVTETMLGDIVSTSSDREALVRAMLAAPVQPGDTTEARAAALLERAQLEGSLERDRLLQAEGGVLSTREAAGRLRTTRQTIDNRRKCGKLIGFRMGTRGYVFPAWQFQNGDVLPGLETVLEALNGHDAWSQFVFVLTGNVRLNGQTPLAQLRRG